MAKRKTLGVSGSALLFGTVGLYLAYVGWKDVPFFEGLRELLRKRKPTPREIHGAYVAPEIAAAGGVAGVQAALGAIGNTLGLEGNALRALPQWRQMFPGATMHGRGERPDNPNSDHPKGKAIDIMTTSEATASRIKTTFKTQAGAHYWIWNRWIAKNTTLWLPIPYTGPNPHTDHVHLSYY